MKQRFPRAQTHYICDDLVMYAISLLFAFQLDPLSNCSERHRKWSQVSNSRSTSPPYHLLAHIMSICSAEANCLVDWLAILAI